MWTYAVTVLGFRALLSLGFRVSRTRYLEMIVAETLVAIGRWRTACCPLLAAQCLALAVGNKMRVIPTQQTKGVFKSREAAGRKCWTVLCFGMICELMAHIL